MRNWNRPCNINGILVLAFYITYEELKQINIYWLPTGSLVTFYITYEELKQIATNNATQLF